MKIRQTKWIIALGFILVGLGIIVASTLPKATQYYVTVDELLADREKYRDKVLKVAGFVKEGSIENDTQSMEWMFRVENNNKFIDVSYTGPMPDTFKDGSEVVVTGNLIAANQVNATHVLAKCASRYEEKLTPDLNTKAN